MEDYPSTILEFENRYTKTFAFTGVALREHALIPTATDEEGFRGFRVLAELKTKAQGVTIPLVPKRIFEVEGNFL